MSEAFLLISILYFLTAILAFIWVWDSCQVRKKIDDNKVSGKIDYARLESRLNMLNSRINKLEDKRYD
jgi:cell division protein FtsB